MRINVFLNQEILQGGGNIFSLFVSAAGTSMDKILLLWVSRVFRLGSVVSSPPSSITVSRSTFKLEINFCRVQVGFDSQPELEAALAHPPLVCF